MTQTFVCDGCHQIFLKLEMKKLSTESGEMRELCPEDFEAVSQLNTAPAEATVRVPSETLLG